LNVVTSGGAHDFWKEGKPFKAQKLNRGKVTEVLPTKEEEGVYQKKERRGSRYVSPLPQERYLLKAEILWIERKRRN